MLVGVGANHCVQLSAKRRVDHGAYAEGGEDSQRPCDGCPEVLGADERRAGRGSLIASIVEVEPGSAVLAVVVGVDGVRILRT